MTEAVPSGAPDEPSAAVDPNAAGNALRAARESAGWSIDAVAQQLKLAPRQVRALEDGNYAELPGRTFVRGFARNYARLLQLDADALVAALPDPSAAPALDKPALGATSGAIGTFDERPRRSAPRLAVLVLVLVLAGLAALYALDRAGVLHLTAPRSAAPSTAAGDAATLASQGAATPLPNPLAGGDAPSPATPRETVAVPAKDESSGVPPATVAAMPSPVPGTTVVPSASVAAPSAQLPPASAGAAPPGAQATLVIDYRANSWTDVRDANGQRLLVGTMPAGSTQTVTGAPPFDVVLGNVSHTTVTWRGSTVDTSAYHRQNVARLRLE
jgi:cytoskeleton protein RodZ